LLESMEAVVQSEEYDRFLEQSGFGYEMQTTEAFLRFLADENEAYGEVLTSEAFQALVSQRYGPMLFPYLILGFMVVIVAALLVSGNLKREEGARAIKAADYRRMVLVVGAVLLYPLMAEYLGFILTGALILFFLLWQFNVRWSTALLLVLIIVPMTYQLFAIYLRVPLPWGLLGW
jgi:hypothetical protein